MLISPLARKRCQNLGIDPATLTGTGPRGRIMAKDVIAPAKAKRKRGTAVAIEHMPPTRPSKDGYYVYDCTVDMRALASMSHPIAVQCDKLLEQRYSLMDYIVRAMVKACSSSSEWMEKQGKIDVLLFENKGEKLAAIEQAENKTLYRIAREVQSQAQADVPADFVPNIVICDAQTSREQVAAYLSADTRPGFALVVRGHSSKGGIRVGCDLKSSDLEFSFYANESCMPSQEADRVAARLNALLFDPVSLLLIK